MSSQSYAYVSPTLSDEDLINININTVNVAWKIIHLITKQTMTE